MNIALDRSECLNSPHAEPYIGSVVSEQELQDFINKTIEQSKQPIVIFGANWCPDARFLEGVLQLSSVKSFIEKYANIAPATVSKGAKLFIFKKLSKFIIFEKALAVIFTSLKKTTKKKQIIPA